MATQHCRWIQDALNSLKIMHLFKSVIGYIIYMPLLS